MSRLAAFLAGLAALAILAAGGLFLAATDPAPLVERDATISPVAIAQARRLFALYDPRRLRKGDSREVGIPANLLDEGINYAATRGFDGRGALALSEGGAELRFTLPLGGPWPRYLNLAATVPAGIGEPHFAAARLGAIPLPPRLAEGAIAAGFRLFGYEREWDLARRAIHSLEFDPARRLVVVRYIWEPEILDRARAIALAPADIEHLRAAQTALAALLDHRAAGTPVPLPAVLKPLLAEDGSRARRRAVLAVLATYLAEKNLSTLVPEARRWPHPRPVALTLHGRYDSAQHFVISAALAAWAGEPLANAIGLYKELDDARRGSGFSFADLAADRAGTRFGELVAGEDARVDRLLAGDTGDADLAPTLQGLPEYLREREFRRRFGGPGSPAYRQMADEIERRIAALPLYR